MRAHPFSSRRFLPASCALVARPLSSRYATVTPPELTRACVSMQSRLAKGEAAGAELQALWAYDPGAVMEALPQLCAHTYPPSNSLPSGSPHINRAHHHTHSIRITRGSEGFSSRDSEPQNTHGKKTRLG